MFIIFTTKIFLWKLKTQNFRILGFIFIALLTSLTFIKCKKEGLINSQNNKIKGAISEGANSSYRRIDSSTLAQIVDERMELGKQLVNPYELSIMKKAFALNGNSTKAKNLIYNRIYVKLNPQSKDQVIDFLTNENENRLISEYPIDYEIVYEGNIYLDKTSTDTLLKPYYCVATSLSDIPNVPYTIINYGYVPDSSEENVEITAFRISGYNVDSLNGYTTPDPNRRFAYKPEGYVDVLNNNINSYVPVRHKSLLMTTFFKWSYVRTNNVGYFKSSKTFIVPVPVHIRHWNQEYSILGHSLWDKIGTARRTNLGYHYQISNTSDRGAYIKACVNNSVFDYNDYLQTAEAGNGIIKSITDGLLFWIPVTPGSAGSGNTILTHVFNFWDNDVTFTALLSAPFRTDIGLRIWRDLDYWNKQCLMFHEFSHYSHAIKAGREFWKDVVNTENENVFHTIFTTRDPYGNGASPDALHEGRVGLAESWAEFMGAVIANYYNIPLSFYSGGWNIEVFTPHSPPHTIPGTGGWHYDSWMPTGLWWDLYDGGLDARGRPVGGNENNQLTVFSSPNNLTTDCAIVPIPYMFNSLGSSQTVFDAEPIILNTIKVNGGQGECAQGLFHAYGFN